VSEAAIRLTCVDCARAWDAGGVRYRCDCGGTLDVEHDLAALRGTVSAATFDARLGSRAALDRSGVWRFRELLLPGPHDDVVTRGEGSTHLYEAPGLARWCGVDHLRLKHEGENPTGSFKDRGMTVGISVARRLGMGKVACASTGNTSASMASYAALAGMRAIVFVPEGQIAYGKLGQALAYGARTLQIAGDFDAAMRLVQEVCARGSIYLLNSVNPFRIEGQKSIGFELLQDLGWEVPDWLVLPGGNLGNNTAIVKGLLELRALGVIDRLPRVAVIQAAGANPLATAWREGRDVVPHPRPDTVATAIRIGAPVSWRKSLRGLAAVDGVVDDVTDDDILDAKARVDGAGIGAEPASCATVAGLRKLVAAGTGHVLKDPDVVVRYHTSGIEGIESRRANAPVRVPADIDAILAAIEA